jgi:hypothetical protein
MWDRWGDSYSRDDDNLDFFFLSSRILVSSPHRSPLAFCIIG